MTIVTADAPYRISVRRKFPMNLTKASQALGISIQRLSRHLRILQIPVERHGYSILIDKNGYTRVKSALSNCEVKRGRKKKAV